MFRTASFIAVLTAGAALAASAIAGEPTASGRVEANGIDYYYEVHGAGEPLLLLHGGLGTLDMFEPILPMLTEKHEVIAVDLHGHGRTPLGDREIDLVDIGDDLAVVLEELGYEKVDVVGYSFGGGAALRLAIQHPERVRRLVAVSAAFARDGFYPGILEQQEQVGAEMAGMMKDTPMYKAYAEVAPDPGQFPALLDAIGAFMKKPYDWAEEVKGLEMPVMLIYGDSDMFRPEHIVEFYQLLGGGLRDAGWQREHMAQNRLAILPDLTHYEMFLTPRTAETALRFLSGESGVTSWAEQVNKQ